MGVLSEVDQRLGNDWRRVTLELPVRSLKEVVHEWVVCPGKEVARMAECFFRWDAAWSELEKVVAEEAVGLAQLSFPVTAVSLEQWMGKECGDLLVPKFNTP